MKRQCKTSNISFLLCCDDYGTLTPPLPPPFLLPSSSLSLLLSFLSLPPLSPSLPLSLSLPLSPSLPPSLPPSLSLHLSLSLSPSIPLSFSLSPSLLLSLSAPPPHLQETSYVLSEEQIEQDELNAHECMLPLMRLLDHMEHNKINPVVPKVGLSVCPSTLTHCLLKNLT